MQYLDEAKAYAKILGKISPFVIMRKFNLNYEAAHKICCTIWMENNRENRAIAKAELAKIEM